MNWLRKMIDLISEIFLADKELLPPEPSDSCYQSVRQAWQEWQDAKQYFNQVSDPGMVDYAIYSLQAAERRYIYLLHKARQELSGFHRGAVPPER
ncbi:MAG TPA: DUF2508 family protein [Firmicutes bacterium]|nr:DUF2508 family protein [Bacillota bacterium]